MDKQKQIEEMAGCKACYDNLGRCPVKKREYCSDYKNATNQYNKGYRKIPENAAVLTREEYELFDAVKKGFPSDTSQLAEKYSEIGQTARNRTAEKFAEKTNQAINAYRKKVGEDEYVVDARRLIFEVNEICKEITEGVK